jgi:hypothetical protein
LKSDINTTQAQLQSIQDNLNSWFGCLKHWSWSGHQNHFSASPTIFGDGKFQIDPETVKQLQKW